MPPFPPPTPDHPNDPLQPRPFLAKPEDPDDPVRRGPPKDPGNGFSRSLAVLATIVLVIAVVALQFMGRSAPGLSVGDDLPPPDIQMLLMGRMAMGIESLSAAAGPTGAASAEANARQILSQLDDLAAGGPVREAVRTAIVAAELDGPAVAGERLHDADKALGELGSSILDPTGESELTDSDRGELERIEALQEDIRALLAIYDAGNADDADLPDETRAQLVAQHGYFGEIALAYGLDNSAPQRTEVLDAGMRTVVTLITAFAIGAVALLTGFVLFIVAIVKAMSRGGIARRYAPPSFGGSVYLETFALFLAGFIVVSIASGLILQATGLSLEYALIWLLPIVAFWPLLRGQPWANHRHAMGWTSGKGIAREVFAGIVGYLALLPVFFFGVLCTIVLSILMAWIEQLLGREPPGPMTHPIMEDLVGGDLKTLLLLLSLAAVWAPLVEESVFRGAFFHHLRGRWRVLASALMVGFVFAVIHPQGFAAIPALMALGFSFSLLREWRGSLIAPMTAHAMHNGFLVTMLWFALS